MSRKGALAVVLGVVACGCSGSPSTTPPVATVEQDAHGRRATLISAFFGLDNGLPRTANLLCPEAAGKDGMPVVLSHTIDQASLQKEDFAVATRSGTTNTPVCVTLAPALGAGELRTVLLVGELGSDEDPPVAVQIVGDLFSDGATGGGRLNFRGANVRVTPLVLGPTLVFAESVPKSEWSVPGRNAGSHCPATAQQVVRAVWAGGIRLPSGDEVGDAERVLYRVTVQRPDGFRTEVAPFALADLDDNDNNHELCLDVTDQVVFVAFPSSVVVDPNGDLNPDTEIAVTR